MNFIKNQERDLIVCEIKIPNPMCVNVFFKEDASSSVRGSSMVNFIYKVFEELV